MTQLYSKHEQQTRVAYTTTYSISKRTICNGNNKMKDDVIMNVDYNELGRGESDSRLRNANRHQHQHQHQ